MTAHTVTLRLPLPVYEQYKRRADRTHRSLEAELLDVVTTAAPEEDSLPPDLAAAVDEVEALSDEALWQAARTTVPAEDSAQLEALHFKRQDEGLTESEQEMASKLIRQYERVMLVRARAAALLKERGHDISGLLVRR